jgi:serine/threonine protein kinase
MAHGLFPFKVRSQRGKGGVYEAVDVSVSPPRLVIIKEGRRHGETDWLGEDGFARIKREARVLRNLHRRRLPVIKPLCEFSLSRACYLVLEKTAGRPLLPSRCEQPKRHSWRRSLAILELLEPVIKALHNSGLVWRDCKPEHIFLHQGRITLIDFEGACRIGVEGTLPWGSPNYMPPIYRKKFAGRRPGTLEDDYALGVIAFQFLSGKFPPRDSCRRASIYEINRCPESMQRRIEKLLRGRRSAN